MTEDRCLHSFSLPYTTPYFFIILSIAASSGGCPQPAALILEGIAVQHAPAFDHSWPILAGIAFGHVTLPVVAACDIAVVPAIVASKILRMLLIAEEVVAEYFVSCREHYLQAQWIATDVILIYLVIMGEI